MHRIPENETDHTRTWTGTIECSGGRMVSPFEGTGKGVLEYLAEKRVSRNRYGPHAYKMFKECSYRYGEAEAAKEAA